MLVVDDDADIRASLVDMFMSVHIDVVAFESTAELLAFGFPDRPCCLILDLRLPGASGLDLQAQLRASHLDVPIIFITGHADVPTSVRAMKAGAVDFIEKPFDDEALLSAIQAALTQHSDDRRRQSLVAEVRKRLKALSEREKEVLNGLVAGKPDESEIIRRVLLAKDDDERRRRDLIMASVHAAYAQGDDAQLRGLLLQWKADPEAVKGELKAAGFTLEAEHGFLPLQYFLVFRAP